MLSPSRLSMKRVKVRKKITVQVYGDWVGANALAALERKKKKEKEERWKKKASKTVNFFSFYLMVVKKELTDWLTTHNCTWKKDEQHCRKTFFFLVRHSGLSKHKNAWTDYWTIMTTPHLTEKWGGRKKRKGKTIKKNFPLICCFQSLISPNYSAQLFMRERRRATCKPRRKKNCLTQTVHSLLSLSVHLHFLSLLTSFYKVEYYCALFKKRLLLLCKHVFPLLL